MLNRIAAILVSCIALAAPAQSQPAPDAKAAPTPKAEWPAIIKKEIHGTDARGKKAPNFVCDEVIGGKKPDRKGKVVLIDFWATWCGPCRRFIPELNKLQDKFKDDLVVIGMSDEPPNVVKDFLKKTESRYTQAVDNKGRMKRTLQISGIPHVIVISTDNIIRWQGFPGSSTDRLTPEIIQQIIDADPGVQARHAKEAKEAEEAAKREGATDKKKAGDIEPDQPEPSDVDAPVPSDEKPHPSEPAPPADPR